MSKRKTYWQTPFDERCMHHSPEDVRIMIPDYDVEDGLATHLKVIQDRDVPDLKKKRSKAAPKKKGKKKARPEQRELGLKGGQ